MENIKTILFDLDGTILDVESDDFERMYMGTLGQYLKEHVDPKTLGTHLWASVKDMITDTSDRLNKTVFFEAFRNRLGDELFETLEPMFDVYYETEFDKVGTVMHKSPEMVEIIEYLKTKELDLILATNPMLPKLGTDKRIQWAGVSPDDFMYVTRFENHNTCKPNPAYYQEILDKYGLKAEECLMVGNDVEEDLVAQSLGMKVWLVDDNLIHRGSEIKADWRGNRKALLKKIKDVF